MRFRIADDAPFAPPNGHIHHRRLPRHPRRECFHFIKRNVGMVANAAFAWPARNVIAARGIRSSRATGRCPSWSAMKLPGSVWASAALAAILDRASGIPPPCQTGFARCETDSDPRAEQIRGTSGWDCGLYDRGHQRRSFLFWSGFKSFVSNVFVRLRARSGPTAKSYAQNMAYALRLRSLQHVAKRCFHISRGTLRTKILCLAVRAQRQRQTLPPCAFRKRGPSPVACCSARHPARCRSVPHERCR